MNKHSYFIINLCRLLFTIGVVLIIFSFKAGQQNYFEVAIIQNGEYVKPVNGVFNLKKERFIIEEKFHGIEGVYLSASFSKNYFGLKDNEQINDFEYLNTKVATEENDNIDKSLLVDDEILSFWFYDPKVGFSRFDTGVVIKQNEVTGRKTIDSLSIQDNRTSIPIQKVDKKLYLFFFALEGTAIRPEKELQRKAYMINWKN